MHLLKWSGWMRKYKQRLLCQKPEGSIKELTTNGYGRKPPRLVLLAFLLTVFATRELLSSFNQGTQLEKKQGQGACDGGSW